MTPMQVGFRQPSPVVVGLEGDRSRWICYHGRPRGKSFDVDVGDRKPRLSNSDEDSEDEVDYDRTPVRKTNVAPTRSVPTRAA
jgi:hypothetical protein